MDKAAGKHETPFIRQASLITGQGGARVTQSGASSSAARRQAYQFLQARER